MFKFRKLSLSLWILIIFLTFATYFDVSVIGSEVTIKGTVIDPFCLLTMGMKGEGHRECAQRCAKAGMNLAIMDEQGKIYPILQREPFTNPNNPVFDYVEKKVTVKGDLIESGGVSYIMIKEVKDN
jgi:hypothetical protein